jgi:hypothetical protein
MRDKPGNCSQHSLVEKSRPAPLKWSSFPWLVMVTLPPGAPPPLGVGPQALPHSPTTQSDRMGVAFQRPASVGDCARADPATAQSRRAIKNFNSGKLRIAEFNLHARTC